MNVILDTQVMIWFFEGSEELSLTARQTIESKSNTCFISIASIWETVRYRSNMVKRITKQSF